jgi:hypothetical protein
MDQPIPPPPADSCFVVDVDDNNRPRLSWRGAEGGIARYAAAAFLGFWLCGWAVGEFFAIGMLLSMVFGIGGIGFQGPAGGGELCVSLFLFGWLGGWTVGGAAAIYAFYSLVRPRQPERLVFGPDALDYDPGTSLLWPPNRQEMRQNPFAMWKQARARRIPRAQAGKVLVERVGERQRLTIDVGAERVEIGPSLSEPEREWLADVLRAWAGKKGG